ncbi:hypothetical protein TURU_049256 [Turdus rufiventris]|nr:hypothetical protein TURU_049256 [Turdus rufiventris]
MPEKLDYSLTNSHLPSSKNSQDEDFLGASIPPAAAQQVKYVMVGAWYAKFIMQIQKAQHREYLLASQLIGSQIIVVSLSTESSAGDTEKAEVTNLLQLYSYLQDMDNTESLVSFTA